jgi:hypothetical protein
LGTSCDVGSHWAYAIIDPDTGASLEYQHLVSNKKSRALWQRSFANELGQLAQGVGDRIKGTETIFFMPYSQIPKDRHKEVTYGHIVVDYKPHKYDPEHTCLMVGGNLIDYPGDVSTPTANTTTTKIVFNSIVSTPNAHFICVDIKNFYLGTPMDRYKYLHLPISLISEGIILQYKIRPLVRDGHVYAKI